MWISVIYSKYLWKQCWKRNIFLNYLSDIGEDQYQVLFRPCQFGGGACGKQVFCLDECCTCPTHLPLKNPETRVSLKIEVRFFSQYLCSLFRGSIIKEWSRMMHPSTCIKLCCFYTTCVCKKNEYFFFFDLIIKGCTDQVLDITSILYQYLFSL